MGHVHPCSIVMLVYQRVFLIWHTPRIDISADFVEYKFLLGYHNPQWGMPINQPVKWLCNGAAAQFVRVNLNGTWLVTGPISSREYPRRNSTINWNHIEWNACWLTFQEKMLKFPHGPPFFFAISVFPWQVFLPSSREERLAAQVGGTWGDRCVQRIWGVLPQ